MKRELTARELIRFEEACAGFIQGAAQSGGIGTLGEKTVHAVLKRYYEPLGAMHEYKVGRYVADIVNENGITEIQTGSFSHLSKKLEAFLAVTHVTLVYPLFHTKYICWVAPDTGLVTARNRSPRTGSPLDACWELYQIRAFLFHPNLTLKILMLDGEEYKLQNGYGATRKKRAGKIDRNPTALYEEYECVSPADYLELLPPLPDPFTTKMFAAAIRRPVDRASYTIRFYQLLGLIEQTGKEGRSNLYHIKNREIV